MVSDDGLGPETDDDMCRKRVNPVKIRLMRQKFSRARHEAFAKRGE